MKPKTKSPETAHSLKQRAKILSTAGHLFWKRGYLATSIDDIAGAASMNKASIYYYFTNKAEILFALASRSMHSLIGEATMIANSELEPDKKLESFIKTHVLFQLRNLGLSGVGQRERRNFPRKMLETYNGLRDTYEGLLREILEQGENRQKFQIADRKLTSLFILGFLNSIPTWYKKSGELQPDDVASQANNFVSFFLRTKCEKRNEG
jgi:TetR/AcrR family transcriptional regulator, cholesterol catabolism regulator